MEEATDHRSRDRDRYNTEVGKDISFQELVDTFDAVLISAGCQTPQELGVPGEELDGVVSGLKFLEDVNLGQQDVWVGKRCVTVGGGFTSMDCVRSVLRMGAEMSVMTYRRSIQEIPVDELELEEAEMEGVEIMYMVSPNRVIGDENGKSSARTDPQRAWRARRQGSPPAGAGRRQRVRHRLRHGAGRHRSAPGQRFLGDVLPNRDRRGVPLLDQTSAPSCRTSGRAATT